MQRLKAIKRLYGIATICYIAIGLLLFIRPEIGLDMICKIIGIFLIAHGILRMAGYFSKDIFQLAFEFDLGLGIISALLGILLILKSDTFIAVLAPCIGIFMIADATLRIQTSINAKKFGITNWWMILIIAIIVAVVGVMLLFVPFETVAVITRLVGLCLCFDGIMNLVVVQSTVHTIKREKDIIDID